jgi:hypothetical protein
MPKHKAAAPPPRKKSVSKAPAAKGRADSRAVQIKNEKDDRRQRAKGNPAKLAQVYQEREDDVDRTRKVHRRKEHSPIKRKNKQK